MSSVGAFGFTVSHDVAVAVLLGRPSLFAASSAVTVYECVVDPRTAVSAYDNVVPSTVVRGTAPPSRYTL